MKMCLLLLCCFPFATAHAWNSVGHRVVAQIAYNHLTPSAKRQFTKDNQILNQNHRYYSLVNAAVWLDYIYGQDQKLLSSVHYIDIPFSTDGSALPVVNSTNAVFAIKMARHELLKAGASAEDRALAVRILLHVIGDIHQPLHAAAKVSKAHPNGDRGGNDLLLGKNPIATNLHAYWDRGAGIFYSRKRHRYSQREIKQVAKKLEQQWPCDTEQMDLDPMHWANESHHISVNQVYTIKDNNIPSFAYTQRAQELTKQQVALAGCRLAAMMNQINQKNG